MAKREYRLSARERKQEQADARQKLWASIEALIIDIDELLGPPLGTD